MPKQTLAGSAFALLNPPLSSSPTSSIPATISYFRNGKKNRDKKIRVCIYKGVKYGNKIKNEREGKQNMETRVWVLRKGFLRKSESRQREREMFGGESFGLL